jgi:enterochelin esterase family protein
MTKRHQRPIAVESIHDFYSFRLDNTRRIDVYLPPDYEASLDRRYKVLYANDGQDMPALKLKEKLEELFAARKIEPIIVVAIHATEDRLREYGISGVPNYRRRGDRASEYAQFIIDEVRPYVNQKYRTLGGAMNTAVMGSSLGGLSAFDLAWHYPDHFGSVGAFSGSFWWRTDNSTWQAQQATRIAHQIVEAGPKRSGLRFWFEAGTHDELADRDRNGTIDSIQDTLELIGALVAIGYRRHRDMTYSEIKGGQHNQATWAQALPDFLHWAFPLHRNYFVRWIDRLLHLSRRNP